MHTLLTQPETFQRYVLCSPDFEWDNRVIFATERACVEVRTDLPARLFLTAGSLEERVIDPTVSNLYRMAALLKNRNYPGLALTLVLFEGETHSSIVSASVARGLRQCVSVVKRTRERAFRSYPDSYCVPCRAGWYAAA